MTTGRNKRIILSLRMESNHAPPAFRADVLTTVLEKSVDHSFRSVLCSKGNTSKITIVLEQNNHEETFLDFSDDNKVIVQYVYYILIIGSLLDLKNNACNTKCFSVHSSDIE